MQLKRRQLLTTLPLASTLLADAAEPAVKRIAVRDLEVFRVHVNARGNWILTRVTTDAGISGIGDASHGGPDGRTVALLKQFFEPLKGRSIFDIEWLRSSAQPAIQHSGKAAAVALSGLEQCLWDIIGKALSTPVYNLFGGCLRRSVRNYANINRSVERRTPEDFARMAERAVSAGFDAVKLAPFDDMPRDRSDAAKVAAVTALGIQRAAAVRQAIGSKRDLLVDAHSKFDLSRGLELVHRIEDLNLFWIEEVTPASPLDDLAAINREAKMPTAGGESIYGVRGFYPYVTAQAVDIVMPDVKYCGGMLELKKIASLAEAADLKVSPHGPASPVGNVAAAHVCAGMPNFLILEHSFGEVPWRAELIDPPERLTNGCMELPDRPGLGITLNARTVAENKVL